MSIQQSNGAVNLQAALNRPTKAVSTTATPLSCLAFERHCAFLFTSDSIRQALSMQASYIATKKENKSF